jgi:hypothetical protein
MRRGTVTEQQREMAGKRGRAGAAIDLVGQGGCRWIRQVVARWEGGGPNLTCMNFAMLKPILNCCASAPDASIHIAKTRVR